MSTPLNVLDQVRQFIKKDELALAINLLSQLLKNSPALDELILQSARHSRISAQIRQGIVGFEQANITQNQISDALIDMVRDMEESVANNPITEQELKQFNENFTPTIHINNSKNIVTGTINADGDVHIGDININTTHTPPPAHLLPAERTPYFIGRASEMAAIQNALTQQQPVLLINGIGGIGKTTLALHYALSHKSQYSTIRWINYSHTLVDSYISALNLYYRFEGTPEQVFEKIRHAENQTHPDRLLIIDNFDNAHDQQSLQSYFADWKVLITTRISTLDKRIFSHLPIDELPEAEALELFKHHYGSSDATTFDELSVKALLPLIYRNTLLIVLLAHIARDSNGLITLQDLHQKYSTQQFADPDLQIDIPIDYYQTPEERQKATKLLACLQIAFKVSQITDPHQIYLLQQLALMPTIGVAAKMLNQWLPNLPTTNFTNALNALANKGWINKDTNLLMHPLVQQLVQHHYPPTPKQHEELIDNLVQTMFERMEVNPLNAQVFIPYATTVANALYKTFDAQKPNADSYAIITPLCNNLSGIYRAIGNLPLALECQQKAIAIFEKVLDKDHPDLANSYYNIAIIYYQMDNIKQAAFSINKAVFILQRNFPNGHPNLTTALQTQKYIRLRL